MKLVGPDPTALNFVAQPSEISAWRNKSKHDLIGHRRYEAVALAGEIGGDVLFRCWTWRTIVSLPSSSAFLCAAGSRRVPTLRASAITVGCLPRSRILRHCCSSGE